MEDQKAELLELWWERDLLEKWIETLATQPFLNEEKREENWNRASVLQQEVESLKTLIIELKKSKIILKDKQDDLIATNECLANEKTKIENTYNELKSKYEIDSDAQLKDISDKLFQYD